MNNVNPPTTGLHEDIFDDADLCVFRRLDKTKEALCGIGDIDLLADPESRKLLTGKLRKHDGLQCKLLSCHDNATENREDWIVLNEISDQLVHLDIQFGLTAGPRFAKKLLGLGYHDAKLVPPTDHSPLSLPSASRKFQIQNQVIKAAFRTRALLPFGCLKIECGAGEFWDQIDVAGVQINLKRVDDTHVKIAVRELRKLRRCIYQLNGCGLSSAFLLWLEHGANLICSKLLSAFARVNLAPKPMRRPVDGGVVIALLGPDGMGKSTQLEHLRQRFSTKFGTRSLYLGSSGVISSIALRFRPGRTQTKSPKTASESTANRQGGALNEIARAFWGLWLAQYRLYTVRRARSLAERGFIVLCDRWPQNSQRGLLDGPVRRRRPQSGRWVEYLFALEERLYDRIETYRPDVMFHLVAPYEVADARKPGELTRDAYDKRISLLEQRRLLFPETVRIDAEMSFADVHRKLFSTIWDHLVTRQNAKTQEFSEKVGHKIWGSLNYSVGGQIVHTIGQLGMLISLSHISGLETVGMFALAMSIVTPVFILANMGLRTSQSLDQEDEFSFSEYAGFRVVTSTLALLACMLLSFIYWADTAMQATLIMFAIAKFFESFCGLSYGTFLKHERVKYVFRSLFIRAFGTLILFIILLLCGAPLWLALIANVGVWAAVAVFMDMPMAYRINDFPIWTFSINRLTMVQIFQRTYLVGGTNFLVGLQPALIRIFVESYLGLSALGVYANISAFFQAGAMISNAIRQLLVSRFSRYRFENNHAATRDLIYSLLIKILLLSAGSVLVVLLMGSTILLIVFGPETAEYVNLFILITLALCFRLLSAITISLRFAYHKRSMQFLQEGLYVLILLGLSRVLIPELGILGAGWILLIVSFLRFFLDGLVATLRIRSLTRMEVG